jgi:hypothetical protein
LGIRASSIYSFHRVQGQFVLKFALLTMCLLVSSVSLFAQNPIPVVNSPLVPASATPGGSAFTLTVNGTGFVSGAVVEWNGAPLTTAFVSSSQLTAQVPAPEIASASTASVTVLNPGNAVGSNVVYLPVATTSPARLQNAPDTPIIFALIGAQNTNPVEPLSVATADFNGDGIPDLAVASSEGGVAGYNVTVFIGSGAGTFTQGKVTEANGVNPATMISADFNGDGKPDLAVLDLVADTVTILLGSGDGAFTAAPSSPVAVGSNPEALVAGDFNHDGKLDVAVANSSDHTISILIGNGDGSFTSAPGSPFSSGLTVTALALGDFNGDGKLDLAAVNYGSSSETGIEIWTGNGDGTFNPTTPIPGPVAFTLAAADFNGDGKLDLAVPNYSIGTVTVLLGNGDGTFTTVPACCGPSNPYYSILSVNAADFNGDGKIDLALSYYVQFPLSGIAGYQTVWTGNGDGTFAPTNSSVALAPEVSESTAMADFNGDGRLDIAAVSSPYSELQVYLQGGPNAPSPDFTVAPQPLATTVTAGQQATANIDVASVNGFIGTVSVSCSGAPPQSTCAVSSTSPVQIFDGVEAVLTLQVNTTAPTTASLALPSSQPRWPLAAGAALLVLLAGVLVSRKRERTWHARALTFAPLAVLVASLLVFTSCGGGGNGGGGGGTGKSGTPAGTYAITVTGTSGSVSHTATFTVTVAN